jgi:hypothetical protein
MRHPASKGKADSNHKAIREAIELLGFPVMDLSHAGNGVEDLLVAVTSPVSIRRWLCVECKVPPIKYTKAQKEWRALTEGWPRITVTSAQDAIDQIRRMTG